MADQGLWFKLWCASLDDPHLDNLSIADFGRWAKLGAYIKRHGRAGSLDIAAPARALCAMLQLPDIAAFHALVSRLPNVNEERQKCNGEGETISTVTYVNWAKYQGDFSTERVRKFRQMERSKRRGDEKRREETKKRREEMREQGTRRVPSAPSTNGPIFHIPPSVAAALAKAPRLGGDARINTDSFWQAEVRANNGLNFAAEVLKAEAWMIANPTKAPRRELPRFLHTWLARAHPPEETA